MTPAFRWQEPLNRIVDRSYREMPALSPVAVFFFSTWQLQFKINRIMGTKKTTNEMHQHFNPTSKRAPLTIDMADLNFVTKNHDILKENHRILDLFCL